MLHLLIKPFQDNDEEGSADSDDACTIMPPAAVCEPLRFDLASVCTAPKSKQVSTYKAPFKKNVGDDDIAGLPEKSQKKRRNEIPSFGKQLGNTLRRSKQKKSIFSTFSGNKEASASASASLPSLSQASASAEPLPSHLASQATCQAKPPGKSPAKPPGTSTPAKASTFSSKRMLDDFQAVVSAFAMKLFKIEVIRTTLQKHQQERDEMLLKFTQDANIRLEKKVSYCFRIKKILVDICFCFETVVIKIISTEGAP